ncbi:HCL210Wp [Eremothecium sinecaudum]|uniref:tRNA-dihydrouridine synthase n=1 Tax=Eremothecium sinecaudum TaxID=45286 RepID=A0A0X8HR66_9SACH|nr:HCL210Wp [Eremothecium sinecaudum]AMD19941.1 HCL210Wp [Eremothecium sinecaudum]
MASICIEVPKPKVLGPKNDPLHLIKTRKKTHNRPATIAGPMVRYSKLPFRLTCLHYNTDIVYTPMILAREFVRNKHARMADFSTNSRDSPLIVQVGVNNVTDLMRFVEMVSPYCDGIGINCGCPIKEQVREGIGSALIYNAELLTSMVRSVKEKYGDKVRLETKIRIHDDLKQTVALCDGLVDAGVDWITVHGRTRNTRSSVAVDLDAIKFIREHIKDQEIPIIANGDCFTYKDFKNIAEYTGVDGVMSARGILSNPALFSGVDKCPWSAVELFWHYAMELGTLPYQLLQHHLHCMLKSMDVSNALLKEMMLIQNTCELIDWFDENFILRRYHKEPLTEGTEIPYRTPQACNIGIGGLDALSIG